MVTILHTDKGNDLINLVNERWDQLKITGNVSVSAEIPKFQRRLRTRKNAGYALFGGCIRDWYLNRKPRDIDLVTWTRPEDFNPLISSYAKEKNLFKGDVVNIDGVIFDIWNLPETTFIKNRIFPLHWETLTKMVPFNVSAIIIVYDGWRSTDPKHINRATVYDNGFFKAMESKVIDFVNPKHPEPKRVARRAICMSERYNFGLSYDVQNYIDKHLSITEQKRIRKLSQHDKDFREGKIKSSNLPRPPGSSNKPIPAPQVDQKLDAAFESLIKT